MERMKRSTGLRCVRCRRKRLKCDHERPCKACITDKRRCVATQRRHTSETKSKKACDDCKRDKARCDSDFPCGRCIIKDRRCSNGEWPMEGSHDPLYKETPGVAYKWTHQGEPLEGYSDPRTG
ncbi:hypothetical protein CYLTODRAFT_147430 [Cylindrobasidium torrendii FP15055 ss-10]|uniref:Zn(2)-C6 fungal-type domain-containing protein n=1 Tax=Cylindrobasidium torrendii FP15055 ss-10 TaxID=1314674 RepID=A0A0D7AY27_9AGAR|nr:hypothetical protein CYLTODRAFT_147430 [Cylindrobasidium torrendii FP15055 ss-10]